MPKLVLFIHIPRTGGMTVNRISVRQYGEEGRFLTVWGPGTQIPTPRLIRIFVGQRMNPEDTWFPESVESAASRFNHLPDEQRARIRFIQGFHIEYGLHAHLPEPTACFTLLRNPVDRVLSHYYWTVDVENRPENVSLYEHISARIEGNLQTKILSGPHGGTTLSSPDEMLERAKRNLRSCAVVGLTERFDETVLLLRKAFGWRMPFHGSENVNEKRPPDDEIPTDVLRQIEADNALDMALYAYAQELFEEQVRQYGPANLARDLWVFRALNFWWQRWLEGKTVYQEAGAALNQRIFDPAYEALARWGGLRRLLPARLTPRVVASVEDGLLFFDLWIGQRMVGHYDPQQQQWEIQRPFHLLVDEGALPGALPGAAAGSDAPTPPSPALPD